jgi:hypothetical protein
MLQPTYDCRHFMQVNAGGPRQWTFLRNLKLKLKIKKIKKPYSGEQGFFFSYFVM